MAIAASPRILLFSESLKSKNAAMIITGTATCNGARFKDAATGKTLVEAGSYHRIASNPLNPLLIPSAIYTGIVKSASQLIDAIHNNSVITIQPERNRSKVENFREKTLSTSRMPSVNSESFRDNRPERVPDNRKDSIGQKKSV